MANVRHSLLTGTNLHEPKGIATATVGDVYIADGIGSGLWSEHAISDKYYGEAYTYNNTVDTVIETANIPIALRQIVTGSLDGFTFAAGGTASISVYADYSGTVAGTVLATSTHGLATDDIITIRGTTSYNGVHQVTVVDATHFYFTDTWVANDGASDYDQGAHLIVGTLAGGKYATTWDMNTAPAGACQLFWQMYINTTAQPKSTSERNYANNDLKGANATATLEVVAGDIIWLSVKSTTTANILNKHGNFNLHQL